MFWELPGNSPQRLVWGLGFRLIIDILNTVAKYTTEIYVLFGSWGDALLGGNK